jgi:hypothetical protein
MKKFTFLLMCAFCLALIGCSKDSEVNAFITEFDSTTNEIVQKIDANPTAAGVDEAQKAFDAKKEGLKAKWDAIKDARGMQVSEDSKKKLQESTEKNMKAITGVASKNAMKLAMDKEAAAKFQKLMGDYAATFDQGAAKK